MQDSPAPPGTASDIDAEHKAHATTAYEEQSEAKIGLAALEAVDPMSRQYIDKLGHLRSAVRHHVYLEENDWFVELANAGDAALQARLGARHAEEFDRCMGPDAPMV